MTDEEIDQIARGLNQRHSGELITAGRQEVMRVRRVLSRLTYGGGKKYRAARRALRASMRLTYLVSWVGQFERWGSAAPSRRGHRLPGAFRSPASRGALMNPLTGAPDSSDRLRAMHYWLLGSPPAVLPIVEGEVALQQAKSNQARQQRLTAIVDATYPPNPGFAQPDPQIDAVRVRGQLFAGPTIRMRGGDTLAHVRVVLSITNSPLALSFLVDPAISEDAFRTLVQAQYAVIAAAAP